MQRIGEKAQDVDRLFALFRQQQTELGGEVTTADKQELKKRLKVLEEELNRYLASEYGINQSHFKSKQTYEKKFSEWLASHKPLHWFIEFHAIMKDGGFDVIIGNPPYVEYSEIKNIYRVINFLTEQCGNLYAFIAKRSEYLLIFNGRLGIIMPLSGLATERRFPYKNYIVLSFQCFGLVIYQVMLIHHGYLKVLNSDLQLLSVINTVIHLFTTQHVICDGMLKSALKCSLNMSIHELHH